MAAVMVAVVVMGVSPVGMTGTVAANILFENEI
jgi:hypothetical protein